MSKKFEPCSLQNATHIEVNGKMYKLGGNEVGLESYDGEWIGIRCRIDDTFIPLGLFPLLGIKPIRETKRKSRECTALTVIAQRNGKDVVALLPTDDFELGMTVRCVEILEDEE